ncbi:hypothetical protein [Burkholderia multivorans]|uniref:hypothetical protein n=1 Tax=Burkholderia multivorans TaxID=87883 RepID=UPI0020194713|nr:hypothetical protein [Burkholderia multivorans]MCO1380735.1 hypothetical protein [Burkholderia multivorans]MCO1400849.1 hypothetical protein [Burkholderia multivorans]UQO77412.1 hypothetical protein L0Z12_16690 [Burkholderia multivorans]
MPTVNKRAKARELLQMRRRGADIVSTVDQGFEYIRLGGCSGVPIRYCRIHLRRPRKNLEAKAHATIVQIAHIAGALAPDSIDEALELPSRELGRLLKAMLRRALKKNRKRGFRRRRPKVRVFLGTDKLLANGD